MLNYVSIAVLDTSINMVKYLQIDLLEVSINCHYLHQDTGKTFSEISKMGSYWKYQKQPTAGKWKRKAKLSVWWKRNILQQAKCLQEEIEKLYIKIVMVKADIPPSIIEKTVRRVLQ